MSHGASRTAVNGTHTSTILSTRFSKRGLSVSTGSYTQNMSVRNLVSA